MIMEMLKKNCPYIYLVYFLLTIFKSKESKLKKNLAHIQIQKILLLIYD